MLPVERISIPLHARCGEVNFVSTEPRDVAKTRHFIREKHQFDLRLPPHAKLIESHVTRSMGRGDNHIMWWCIVGDYLVQYDWMLGTHPHEYVLF